MAKNKEAAAADSVFQYLVVQNRPYSVNDIVQNLHKEHGKTVIQKSLDQLVVEGKIREKSYGKQKVYAIDQNQLPAIKENELLEMDSKINELTKEIEMEEGILRKSENELKMLNLALTTEEAKDTLAKITEENLKLEKKLAELSGNKVKVSADDFKKFKNIKEKNVKEWRKRKRLCNDMLDAILEGYPKEKKALFEEMGIETDEDTGAQIPA